jgi:hypothetical protein
MGIRILHLFKEDWESIHNEVYNNYDLNEKPTANYREGDNTDLFEKVDCKLSKHKYGYRSVHYLLKYKPSKTTEYIIELQVRTVFEEAWSEIDHQIRYPYDMNNPILAKYLSTFNTLAGNADEMGTYIKFLKNEMDNKDKIIENLKLEIENSKISKTKKANILSNIEQLDTVNIESTTLNQINETNKFIKSFDFSSITSIPKSTLNQIIETNKLISNFSSSSITSIPKSTLNQIIETNKLISNFSSSSITSIPKSTLNQIIETNKLISNFSSSSITSIPKSTLNQIIETNKLISKFSSSSITSIPKSTLNHSIPINTTKKNSKEN